MKKTLIVPVLMMALAGTAFSYTEEVNVYAYLYNATTSNSQQLDILQNMSEANLTGAGEFYASALRRLVSEYKNIKSVTERNAAAEQAIILSAQLGQERYSEAAADLWFVVEAFAEPLVKAEALMALGKIQATAYLPQVIRVLQSLNTAPTADRLYGERIAFGAIIALEKYQDPSGYLPVFFAATGWYSNRIKTQAFESLPIIAEDPTSFMMEVVKGPGYDYPTKLKALEIIDSSGAPNASKASVAVAALGEGWKASTNDIQLRTMLARMRKLSMNIIYRHGTDEDAVYPLLERSYKGGYDNEEKFNAISTIAQLATDESARRLSSYLMVLNEKRQSNNIRPEDEQMVRAIIPALGKTGRTLGRPALNAVVGLDWTPAVKALANDAIKQLSESQ